MPTYNSNANVMTLAEAVAQNPDVKGRLWSRMLEVGANTADDFAAMEGAPDSDKPFWKRRELSADGGDKVTFTTIGDVGGPGVRGEQELTGKTSKARMGAYTVQVDYWRDAVELTKKQIKFLAAGKSLESTLLKMLSKKLGRQKMYDMMHSLKRTPSAVYLRPNNKLGRESLRATDTITPSFLVDAKARLQGIGGRPIDITKSASGSPVWRYMSFIGQDAMVDIRNSTSYQNALQHAAERDDKNNPLFSGKLVDWNGIALWEHIIVDPDADDATGSPIAPKAILGEAIAAGTTAITVKAGSTATLPIYFRDFPGYDYLFTEDQTAAPDTTDYFFWVVNNSGGSAGKCGFYRYTGTGNTGNTIVTKNEAGNATTGAGGRLGAAVSGNTSTKIGLVVWDSATMTDAHPVGSWIIPANQYGVPVAEVGFMFGAGAALRAYGSTEADPIYQDRDYKFVKGMGYESIFGQKPALDTQGVPRNYAVIQAAIAHPGITVPYITA